MASNALINQGIQKQFVGEKKYVFIFMLNKTRKLEIVASNEEFKVIKEPSVSIRYDKV